MFLQQFPGKFVGMIEIFVTYCHNCKIYMTKRLLTFIYSLQIGLFFIFAF